MGWGVLFSLGMGDFCFETRFFKVPAEKQTLRVVVGGWGWLSVGLGLGLFRSPLGLAKGFYVELPRESGQLVLAGGWWGGNDSQP